MALNEAAAWQVLLVRALESADTDGKVLTGEERSQADRAAAESVRWEAAQKGEHASAEAFVTRRAQILTTRFAERSPKAHDALRAIRWRPWIGIALPLAALVFGAAAEHLVNRQRLNLLAFPLLGLIVWNVAVYLWLAARFAFGLVTPQVPGAGGLRRLVAGVRSDLARRLPGPLSAALAAHAVDWAQRSAPLAGARAARILHVSAVLLALGAVTGLYVRGLAFEYRAGWESTFLDANAVHAVLAIFLEPAAWLASQPFPTVGELAALRWGEGAGGENAARWIHLYSVTVGVIVVLPRLVLAVMAGVRERRLSARFPISLDEPYFRRALAHWRESPASVRVSTYAYTPAQAAQAGLKSLAAHLFGRDVRVDSLPPVAYGEEDEPAPPAAPGTPAPDLVIALFTLGSTPEIENHGVFLEGLRKRTSGALAVIVDESPLRLRLGGQAGATARLTERRQAWSGFVESLGLHALFVDLDKPDLAAAERDIDLQPASSSAPA